MSPYPPLVHASRSTPLPWLHPRHSSPCPDFIIGFTTRETSSHSSLLVHASGCLRTAATGTAATDTAAAAPQADQRCAAGQGTATRTAAVIAGPRQTQRGEVCQPRHIDAITQLQVMKQRQ